MLSPHPNSAFSHTLPHKNIFRQKTVSSFSPPPFSKQLTYLQITMAELMFGLGQTK